MRPASPPPMAGSRWRSGGGPWPRAASRTPRKSRPTAWLTNMTFSNARRRDCRPPTKSDTPQHNDEARARARPGTGHPAMAASPLPAGVEQGEDAAQHAGPPGTVGEHERLALERPAGDEQRLGLAVLADAAGAVARAEPGGLPAAHGQVERRIVDLGVVDAHHAGLDAPGERLAARDVAGPHTRLQAVGRVVGQGDA